MPPGESFSDDYVASLLAQDAKASTARYSTTGLQALLPSRPTTNAPKANTRFLRNIIKETDSHNAALRAKDAQDAKARLRRTQSDSLKSSKSGKIYRDEDDHHPKRRRIDPTDDEYSMPRRRSEKHSLQKKKYDDDRECRKSHRRRQDYYATDEALSRHSQHRRHGHYHHNRHRRSRSLSEAEDMKSLRGRSSRHEERSHSPKVHTEYRHNRHNRRRRRRRSTSSLSRSPSNSHIVNPGPSRRNTSPKPKDLINGNSNRRENPASYDSQDSDPLDSIIGPCPPPPIPKIQARGRGTFASSATIDAHFSSRYDPATDVRPDPDTEDDWDQALEALRDRQRWKQQGADRLRAAGFTEEEVGKWENTGGEKREEDVRWRGRGEDREWDRGKVVGKKGIETMPEWGRLKGT